MDVACRPAVGPNPNTVKFAESRSPAYRCVYYNRNFCTGYDMTIPDAPVFSLDRLHGLQKVIPDETIRQIARDCGFSSEARGPLPAHVTLWLMVAVALFSNLSIRQVYVHSRRFLTYRRTPTRSAFCQARRRLGIDAIERLFRAIVRPLARPKRCPSAFFAGLRWVGIDGTTMDIYDSLANETAFGRPGSDRGPGAFPQLRKVSLVELGTHAELAFVVQGCNQHGGERAALPELLSQLPEDSLLTMDQGFFSHDLVRQLLGAGRQFLLRVPAAVIWPVLEVLSDGSFISESYANESDRLAGRGGMRVRVIRYTLNDPNRVGFGKTHVLVTTLLDAEAVPAVESIVGYHERWEHELVFDERKTHLDPRRAQKPAQLRSQTPDGVRQELVAVSLGHYVVRAMMSEAAAIAGIDPDRLSFAGCVSVLVARLPECIPTAQGVRDWWTSLLTEMGCERTEPRRDRVNPRVIKRKMSNRPKKHPHHRRKGRLAKTFAETIVMAT